MTWMEIKIHTSVCFEVSVVSVVHCNNTNTSRNRSSVILQYTVNLIDGCKLFCSLKNVATGMSTVQIMKQSSKNLFQLFYKNIDKSLLYLYLILSYMISSRYANTSVAYVGTPCVPIAVPFLFVCLLLLLLLLLLLCV